MDVPTPDDLRSWSKVDFGSLGYEDDEQLQVLIDRSAGWFTTITGRPVDSTMPDELVSQSQAVLQRMVELVAYQSQADQIETLADFMVISSFSAGNYSETRRSLEEIQKAKMITGDPVLNGWLLGLLTPDQLDWWLGFWSGENLPNFAVTEVSWGLYSGIRDPSMFTGETYGVWSW